MAANPRYPSFTHGPPNLVEHPSKKGKRPQRSAERHALLVLSLVHVPDLKSPCKSDTSSNVFGLKRLEPKGLPVEPLRHELRTAPLAVVELAFPSASSPNSHLKMHRKCFRTKEPFAHACKQNMSEREVVKTSASVD